MSSDPELLPEGTAFAFNTAPGPEQYAVSAPDAIEPADEAGATVLRYAETNKSAAVARWGACPTVVFGFPFEAILTQADRDAVMQAVLRYLTLGAP